MAVMPEFIQPQLCKLVDTAPAASGWVHEVKYDGYRIQVRVRKGVTTLRTRNGYDWTSKFPGLAKAASEARDCIIDGELCALDADGQPDFPGLLTALSTKRTKGLVFFAFDAMWDSGVDLRSGNLLDRKTALAEIIDPCGPSIRFSSHITEHGPTLLKAACASRLEGIVSKRIDAPYQSGRGDSWLKSKCRPGQEVVIGGWTEERGRFRSLLAGVFNGRDFTYVGKVGSGYSERAIAELAPKLETLRRRTSPFVGRQPTSSSDIRWTKPSLVAQVEFAAWTGDKLLRQASFKGLRKDKAAAMVVLERA